VVRVRVALVMLVVLVTVVGFFGDGGLRWFVIFFYVAGCGVSFGGDGGVAVTWSIHAR
jgi:hypothetical protein